MPGLLYSAAFENITLTDAAQDIVFLSTSASVSLRVHAVRMTANVITDVRARIQIIRRTTAGSAGTGITPKPLFGRNTVSAATTATYARTTPGTAGDLIHAEQWSLLVPFEWLPTPEMRPDVGVSSFLGVNLAAATGASRVVSGSIIFEEL
jgi:hypothetical protein